MATIITRSGKGTPLTHAEMDANWNNINNDKLDAVAGGIATGFIRFHGGISFGKIGVSNVNFTVAADEGWYICNGSGAITATLPSPSVFPQRVIGFKTITAQSLSSASANVAPINSLTGGTAILPATAGAWAILVSGGGANWNIMAQG